MLKAGVLFVDDELKVLRAWQRHFSKEPYKMHLAVSAEQALQLLEEHPISLMVTDYKMPGTDGLELLQQTYKRFPNVARIMVSGNANLKVAATAVNEFKIEKFYQKPCNPVDLAVGIREVLSSLAGSNVPDGLVDYQKLEGEYPGITKLDKDERGYIKL